MNRYANVRKNSSETRVAATTAVLLYGFSELVQWEFTNLAAPFWRWYCNEDAGGFIVVGGRRVALTPGRVFLIPPNTDFAAGLDRRVRQSYIHFTISRGHMEAPGVVFSHRATPLEQTLRRRLRKALQQSGPDAPLPASFTASALVGLALDAVPPGYWQERAPDSRIDDTIERIRKAFPRAVKNPDLAANARMNVNAFTSYFRQKTGLSPREFLHHLRMDEACALLRRGEASLDDIAERTGYCDRFHFSRAFKAHLRVSPAQFRRAAERASRTRVEAPADRSPGEAERVHETAISRE